MSDITALVADHLEIWTGAIERKSGAGRGGGKRINLYGIERLRALILDLAVLGKLVPQDHADEPATKALERLAKARVAKIKAGLARKPKSITSLPVHLRSLPSGWVWTQLGTIAEISPSNVAGDDAEASFVPMAMVSTSISGEHEAEIRRWGEIKKGFTHFADGDLGLAKITPCFENGKAAIFQNLRNGIGAGTTELHIARPWSDDVNRRYILLTMKTGSFLANGEKQMTGTAGQKRVTRAYFEATPLPFPPLAEQRRIVAKVDELMALCDALERESADALTAHQTLVETLLATLVNSADAADLATNWARLETHFDTLFTTDASIEALKQTILDLAVRGKLVKQDAADEAAKVALERLAKARATKLKAGLARKPKLIAAMPDDLIALPSGWAWTQLGTLAEISPGNSVADDTKASFVPMAMISTSISGEHEAEVRRWGEIKKGFTQFAEGDIGLAKITPCFENGKAAIFQNLENGIGAGTTELHVARPWSDDVNRRYILLTMKTGSFLANGEKQMTGTAGQKRVTRAYFEATPLPFPPLAEQQRIVAKVDALMALCDQLKTRLADAAQTQRHLADAITERAAA